MNIQTSRARVAVIPVTDIIILYTISNGVLAHSVSRPFDRPAPVQGSSESFASTCAALLLSAVMKDTSVPGGDGKQFPKAGSGTGLPRGNKTKSKNAQQDSLSSTASSVATISVPAAVPQVAQTDLPAALPGPSGLKPLPAIAGPARAIPTASVPFQVSPMPQIRPDTPAGTSKMDKAGNTAPPSLPGRTTDSWPTCSLPLPSRLHLPEPSQAPAVHKDATAGNLPAQEIQSPTTDRISAAMLNPPLPETVKQPNSTNQQAIPAIYSDSRRQVDNQAVSIFEAAPLDAAVAMPHPSPIGSEANLLLKAITGNIQQETASPQPLLPQIENSQVGHQPVAPTPPSRPSSALQEGKVNAPNADNPSVMIEAPGPHRLSNILAQSRNGVPLYEATVLAPRPIPDPGSIPANISAVSGSAALPLPQTTGSRGTGTTSIANRDNHSSTSIPGAPPIALTSIFSNRESQSQSPPRDATQPVHKTPVAATPPVAAAPTGVPQAPPVAPSAGTGRPPAAGPAIPLESLPRQTSGTPSTAVEAPHLPSRVAEPPAAPSVGPVQVAQIINKASQAEMRIGLSTSAFGNVEVRTVVHATEVGLAIGSERGDLRGLMGNELPGIANTLQQQNLRLHEVNFHQGFTFSGNLSSGDQSHPRPFVSTPVTVRSAGVEANVDKSIEPGAAEIPYPSHAGLNILA